VLVLDRGFPSHALVRALTRSGGRFVLRVRGEWKLTHPQSTGQLRELYASAPAAPPLRWFGQGVLGQRGKGAASWSQAHVVGYLGVGHQEPWFLLTTARRAAAAVALDRQRMRIECEFRDLKGPLGLDELSRWQDRERVARYLLWVAVYEWRLAHLWVAQQLEGWRPRIQLKGQLSWIRVTREWLKQQWRAPAGPTPAWL
jgi:Transposase DDE domain